MADTQLQQLIINQLTKAQYEALTPEANQLYLVTDEVPIDSSNIATSITSAGTNSQVAGAKAVYDYHDSTKYDASNPSGFITSSAITGKENTSNKVTSLSASSTNTQYPSAKCVYDIVGNIETALDAIRGV